MRDKILEKKLRKYMRKYMEAKTELESRGSSVQEYRAPFGTHITAREGTLAVLWPMEHNVKTVGEE